MSPEQEGKIRDMVQKYRFQSANITLMGELLDVIDDLRESVVRIERSMDGIRAKDYIDTTSEPGGL